MAEIPQEPVAHVDRGGREAPRGEPLFDERLGAELGASGGGAGPLPEIGETPRGRAEGSHHHERIAWARARPATRPLGFAEHAKRDAPPRRACDVAPDEP